jgi:hypothetical protein
VNRGEPGGRPSFIALPIGPAPFGPESGEYVPVTKLEARRTMISSEEERRVRNLERET